jgi:hypothetical protein
LDGAAAGVYGVDLDRFFCFFGLNRFWGAIVGLSVKRMQSERLRRQPYANRTRLLDSHAAECVAFVMRRESGKRRDQNGGRPSGQGEKKVALVLGATPSAAYHDDEPTTSIIAECAPLDRGM